MNKNISRRSFVKRTTVATAGVGLLSTGVLGSCSKKKERPNVLFIFPDQYRKQSLGFLKNDPVLTPNIDKLASEGIHFTDAVSNHPLCSPFRGMLFSGKYPLSNGVQSNCHSGRTAYGNFLKPDERCLSDIMKDAGYATGYLGKWHLDGPTPTKPGQPNIWDSYCPPGPHRHGFEFWYSYGTHNRHNHPYYWINDAKENERTDVNQWSPEHEADVLIDYLDNKDGKFRDEEKPFFMCWGINPPHTPFNEVPQKYKKRFEGKTTEELLNRPNVKRNFPEFNASTGFGDSGVEKQLDQAKDYFACVEGVDDQIGRVLDMLEKKGLKDNTMVIFCSDHGEMLGSHGLMHKNIWYKESFEIPFIIRWPEKLRPGKDNLLLSVPDIMPTLLSFLGLGDQIPSSVEGKDYSGVLRGEAIERPKAALYFFDKPEEETEKRRGVKTHEYTYIIGYDRNNKKHIFLYDDVNDPYQMTNIAGTKPDVEKELHQMLEQLLHETKDYFISYI